MKQINKVILEHDKIHDKLLTKLEYYKNILFISILITIVSFFILWWLPIIFLVIDYIIFRFFIVPKKDDLDINYMVLEKMKECKGNEIKEMTR